MLTEVGSILTRRRNWPGSNLVPPLGRRAWWLLAGYALEKLGSGLIWPFMIVYMHEVRGIDLATAGLVLSAASVAGVIAVPVSGELVRWVSP